MKVVFHENFKRTDYASDGASAPGRMDSIMSALIHQGHFPVIAPEPAPYADLLPAHSRTHIHQIAKDPKLYEMALLSAGGALLAADTAMKAEPTFACIRPPGHHASRNSAWGYCAFSNMGIALLKLKKEGVIKSAFVLDIDAHTGDGNIDVLSGWEDLNILNPMADNNREYLKLITDRISHIGYVDIVGVSAGFDAYKEDLGKKLTTFDFYLIGRLLKKMTKRMDHDHRFALLEGGYYLPDLGKNVLAFCQGFE
jgi:acetoin utilization deacetylase AcuC-like enzyme